MFLSIYRTFLEDFLRVLDFRISLLFFTILCKLLLSCHRTTIVYCEKTLMTKQPCHLGSLQLHVKIQLYIKKIFPGYWFTGSVWLYPGGRWQRGNWALTVLHSLLHKPDKSSLNEFTVFSHFYSMWQFSMEQSVYCLLLGYWNQNLHNLHNNTFLDPQFSCRIVAAFVVLCTLQTSETIKSEAWFL